MAALPQFVAPHQTQLRRIQTLEVWRLEREQFLSTWDQGIGAGKVGGRWSPPGMEVVYASLDPSTCVMEVAVHAGFEMLDTTAHQLLCIQINAPEDVYVVQPHDVPNPNWLMPGSVTQGQQRFGGELLRQHAFVLVPSVVCRSAWNLLINPALVKGRMKLLAAERAGLDGRLVNVVGLV
jgi:RES domain-containing protein